MAQVISRRSIIYDILFDVEKGKRSAKDAEKALDNIGNKSSGLNNSLKTLGKTIAASFAVERVLSFLKTASELADKAGAIRVAFDKLNGVSLAKLREATGGAVNDIVLMQKAVQASHFKVPLQELEKLFRFATIRAKETGESVDGLVDAIIEGLGGGSARAFKALGISSTEFQNKIKQTGNTTKAVTEIIDASFKRTGNSLEGLVDASDKLDTSITNFQITIGSLINEGFLDDFKDWLGDAIQLTTDLISGQRNYNEELAKTGAAIKKFTEEDTKRMITTANVMIEVQKQQADQGRQLSEIEIQAIKDRFEAQAQAMIESTKIVETELEKQGEITREKQEDILFDPNLFEKQRQILLDALQKISDNIAKANEGDDFKIAPQIDNTALIEYGKELLRQQNQTATFGEVVRDNANQVSQSLASIFIGFSQIAKEGSNAQIGLSIANILAANAEALANAIASAAKIPYPGNIPAILSSVATITGIFAQVKAIMNQAKAAQAQVQAFAEGEVDIHRPGEKRGKDSIPAVIMPGETVTTTEKTRKYKPFLEAIHDGSLEDLIKVNYVEPALALRALEQSESDSALIDYSDRFYRQLLATGEGNSTNKRALSILARIERNTSNNKKRYH